MKETRFIAQNKEKWQESETLLGNSDKDPEKLSSLFTQVIDDLSYSRTYYPNRSVRVYLNKIAREYFSIIYSHQKSKKNPFRHFWLDELPQIVYVSRKPLIISLVVFVVASCIGVFSSLKDPQFASIILGDTYVAMTKANIEKGDPMAVYKEAHQVDMFLGITLNNLRVAFYTYVSGIFLSIGTIGILLSNGIMVGCFQFFFIERGLLAESALTIWLHGTLEISSIILAGGAGLTLGSGLLFPGTYSRLQAFQITAMRSLKLMLGIAPIFVIAGLIESFLTRYTEVPDLLRLFFILLCASFIIGYFVLYPWIRSKKGFGQVLPEVKLPASIEQPVSVERIKNNAEIIKDAFLFYKKFAGKLLAWISLVTFGATIVEILSSTDRIQSDFLYGWWQSFFMDLYYALKTPTLLFWAINAVCSAIIIYRVFVLLESDIKNISSKGFHWKSAVQSIIIVAVVYGLIYSLEEWGILLLMSTFIFFLLLTYTQQAEEENLIYSFSRTWALLSEGFGQGMGLQAILLMMSFSFLVILSAPLFYMNTTILQWNFAESDVWSREIVDFIVIYTRILAFNLILPLFASSAAYLYFSLREIKGAENLKRSIANVGIRSTKSIRL